MIAAVQYWSGDEERALALARLIADIEPKRREDAILVLSRRLDCKLSEEAARTARYCEEKLPTMLLHSKRPEVGHPDGSFGLWAGTVGRLHRLWMKGALPWEWGKCVFTCEADGAPIRKDWIDQLRKAHHRSLAMGKRITGAVMDEPLWHVNGNLVMDLSVWSDHPTLAHCPNGVAWDCHHATILLPEARACLAIRNEYQTRDWTLGALRPIGRESAWLHGVRDESVVNCVRAMMRAGWR